MPNHKFLVILLMIFCMTGFVLADVWKPVTPTGTIPSARSGHTMVMVSGVPYLFGGESTGTRAVLMNDLWDFIEESNEWQQVIPTNNPPKARKNHAAVAYGEKMFIFFGVGSDGYPLSDIWAYDINQKRWDEVITSGSLKPTAKGDHSIVLANGNFYMFGGKDRYSTVSSELWSLNLRSYTWNQEPSYSLPSEGHRTVTTDTTMYVYGGDNGQLVHSHLLSFNFAKKAWQPLAPQGETPTGRTLHIATLDANKIRISGGKSQTAELGDTWEYDIVSNQWVHKADGPVQSRSAAVVLPSDSLEASDSTEGSESVLESADAAESNVFMFGGLRNGQAINETWEYAPNEEPSSDKQITNQIGVLGRGRFALYVMKYAEEQAKVKVDVSWAQEAAQLKLRSLQIPCWWKHKHPLMANEDSWENIGMEHMQHFQEMKAEPVSDRGGKTISVTFEKVKKGYLLLMVHHHNFCSPAARDIQLKISELTSLPKKIHYTFFLGDTEKGYPSRIYSVTLPKVKACCHTFYPPHTGKPTIETGDTFWKWTFTDTAPRMFWLPACVKIRIR